MLLTEQKMLILQFVVLIFFTIFTVLRIYKMFFYSIYNMFKVWVLLSCFSVVIWVNVVVVSRCGRGGSSIGMASE